MNVLEEMNKIALVIALSVSFENLCYGMNILLIQCGGRL